MSHPVVTVVGAATLLGVSIAHHLSPSDLIIVIGAIAFALSSLRAGRMKILRDINIDLKERNEQLETSTRHMLSESHKKDAEILVLKERPTLETHELLLNKLLDRLEAHDNNMATAAKNSQVVFQLMVDELKAIHAAVVPSE